MQRTLLRYKLHHLLFWLIAGVVWYYLRYQDYRSTAMAIEVTLIKIIDIAFLIYFANYVLIPRLLYQKKYFLFAISFLGIIALSSVYKLYLIGTITGNTAALDFSSANLKTRIYDNYIPHFFLVIAGMAFKLLHDHLQMQKRLAEVGREKAVAELNFLKSQINPHFLFNSLNSVYFLIDKENTEARQALHKFSEMLRFQLYEAAGAKIPIEKEISYLEDYIGLQQLRNENCHIHLDIDRQMKSFYIEPLLLIPFVENSFKHLSHYSNGRLNEIHIGLNRQNGRLDFGIRNTTEPNMPVSKPGNGGIGLANVKRRLELLYPDKHSLQVSQSNGWFDVQLTIKMEA